MCAYNIISKSTQPSNAWLLWTHHTLVYIVTPDCLLYSQDYILWINTSVTFLPNVAINTSVTFLPNVAPANNIPYPLLLYNLITGTHSKT